jgi:hypothetical protein
MKQDRGRDARRVCTDLELELKARVASMERHIRMRWGGGRRWRHGLGCVCRLRGGVCRRWCAQKNAAGALGPGAMYYVELRLYDQGTCAGKRKDQGLPRNCEGVPLCRMGNVSRSRHQDAFALAASCSDYSGLARMSFHGTPARSQGASERQRGRDRRGAEMCRRLG